jgi:hypothetical protein
MALREALKEGPCSGVANGQQEFRKEYVFDSEPWTVVTSDGIFMEHPRHRQVGMIVETKCKL